MNMNNMFTRIRINVILSVILLLSLIFPGTVSVQAAVLRTVTCSTATEVINALKNALPGDDIIVKPGTYTGSTSGSGSAGFFYSGVNGTASKSYHCRK